MRAELEELIESFRVRRQDEPKGAFTCDVCEDIGLLWTLEQGRLYRFWGTRRCPCGHTDRGYVKVGTGGGRELADRTWDKSIPMSSELPRDQIFNLSQRLEYEHAEWIANHGEKDETSEAV